jgi:DNA polymerase-1
VHFGLDTIASDEKEGMRNLILGGGPWSSLEQTAILDYCEGDVDALARLLPVMLPDIDLPRALLRGRCMADNAWIERDWHPYRCRDADGAAKALEGHHGRSDRQHRPRLGVFEKSTFTASRFAKYLEPNNIPWKRLKTGALDLKEETFAEAEHRDVEMSKFRWPEYPPFALSEGKRWSTAIVSKTAVEIQIC